MDKNQQTGRGGELKYTDLWECFVKGDSFSKKCISVQTNARLSIYEPEMQTILMLYEICYTETRYKASFGITN